MAVIQITSTFSSDPRLTATPAPFDFFRKIPAYFFSMDSFAPATSEGFSATGSFSAFGAPPLAVSFTGTAFTYIDYSGNFDPALGFRGLPASGDVTGFIVSETTQSFPNGPAGPSSAQNTTFTVSDVSFNIADLEFGISGTFAGLSDILLRINGGSDRIFGSQLVDIIAAGTGDDEVYAFGGNDTVYGGAGNDFIVGENGDDLLFGNEGSDWIIGGAGDDFLVGDDGFDTLIGGDGDDGIVFDPNDNLAGYDGGNGFDTLFIDFASGGNPFSVNLAAQGFEQAIITRNDTENLPWAQIITVYDSAWRVSKYDFVQDDGSKSVWYQDVDSSRPWRELRDYFTSSGALDFQQVFNDDGTTLFIDFDLANTEQWSIRRLLADGNGAILSDSYVADALEVRHELFKAPVKASALPEGGIL